MVKLRLVLNNDYYINAMNLFKSDLSTNKEDIQSRLATLYAIRDLSSTFSGSIVAIVGAILPIIILLTPELPTEIKIASLAGGGVISLGGTAIARQQPRDLQDPKAAVVKKEAVEKEEDDVY